MLMPMGFSTLLGGGTCTTIGTSTNLLVVSVAAEIGLKRMDMFDFLVPATIAGSIGIAYLWLVAPRIIPERQVTIGETTFPSGRPLPCHGHPEPHRAGGYLAAAQGPGGSVHAQNRHRLPGQGRREGDHEAGRLRHPGSREAGADPGGGGGHRRLFENALRWVYSIKGSYDEYRIAGLNSQKTIDETEFDQRQGQK